MPDKREVVYIYLVVGLNGRAGVMAINVRNRAGRGIILLKTVNSWEKGPSCEYHGQKDTRARSLEYYAMFVALVHTLLVLVHDRGPKLPQRKPLSG